jgi:hypothetical protein
MMNYAPDQIWLVPLRGAAPSRRDWMTMTPLPQHLRHIVSTEYLFAGISKHLLAKLNYVGPRKATCRQHVLARANTKLPNLTTWPNPHKLHI